MISQRIHSGQRPYPISVNLSRQHFRNPNFFTQFAEIAKQYQIPARMIELELTEAIFFDEKGIEAVKKHIAEMHRLGFLCSLDDFGIAYSSLSLLTEFDIDVIKLDHRFSKNIRSNKTKDLIASVIGFAHKSGMLIVAEGIETQEQLAFLKSVNCDMIQGYIYAKPFPSSEFEEWLKHRKKESLNHRSVDNKENCSGA